LFALFTKKEVDRTINMIYHVYMDTGGLGKKGRDTMNQPKQSTITAEDAIFAFEDAATLLSEGIIPDIKRFMKAFAAAGYTAKSDEAPLNRFFQGFVLGIEYAEYLERQQESLDE